jgi:hypothetical protein
MFATLVLSKKRKGEKGKVIPVLNYALCHEDVWGSGGTATPLVTWVLDNGEWSATRPRRFTCRETDPSTHWVVGYSGLSWSDGSPPPPSCQE